MLDPKTILFLRYCWFKKIVGPKKSWVQKNAEQKSVAGTNFPKKDAIITQTKGITNETSKFG